MKFHSTTLDGVWRIELDRHEDERGYLARTFCEREFEARGLNTRWPQCTTTLTRQRGMIRGLHYQAEPAPEIKLIRCTAGLVFDVLVDLRRASPTFGRWESFELPAQTGRALYVPGGIAHGFQCLADGVEMFYQMSMFFDASLARGVRWDSPSLGIPWPMADPVLSERDRALPVFGEEADGDGA